VTCCVTGGTGFVALHVVKQLLEGGHNVRATVRSLSNEARNAPLTAMSAQFPGRLTLLEGDLLKEGSFDSSVEGCDCVFHTASPFTFKITDPIKDLVEPAVNGTVNVLRSCAKASVKRVVLTSSFAAIFDPSKTGATFDETCWNDYSKPDMDESNAYRYSKTTAERAAWDFVKDTPLELVTICPPLIFGSNLNKITSLDDVNQSSGTLFSYVSGAKTEIPNGGMGMVDVEDVAAAHVRAMDTPAAKGQRYLCSAGVWTWFEVCEMLRTLFPDRPVPTTGAGAQQDWKMTLNTSKIQTELGLVFRPIEQTLKGQIQSLLDAGL